MQIQQIVKQSKKQIIGLEQNKNSQRSQSKNSKDQYKDKKKKVQIIFKQKKNNQRSRSRKNDRRSRSEKKKKKHKRNRSKSRYQSKRSRSRQRQRQRNHYKKDPENRHRGRSREEKHKEVNKVENITPKQVPMPLQVPMPPLPGERRRRERSRSPLDYYRRNQNNNQGQFWDSFSWVPRINYTPNVSSSALVNTKKMRRLMITNIPFQIGITQDDLRDLITRYMSQNYLKDQMNSCPVVNLQINQTDRNVAVELSSVEETCRICKLDKIELFKGLNNGIIRLGDSMYGNNVVTQAENAAKAQAAAFAAINVLENKKTNFNLSSHQTGPQSSTLIRVTNAVTPYMSNHMTDQQWQDYHQDLIQGFSQYGKIVHNWFVKKNEKDICSDPGNLFIEYQQKQQAQMAMSQMNGRIYDERTIKLFYVPRDLYYLNFQKDVTPPILPPPTKIQKTNSQKIK